MLTEGVEQMDTGKDSSDLSVEAQRHLELAYVFEEKNEFENALRECESAIQLAPDWAEAHNLRGIVLEGLDQKEKAIAAYREAVHLDSTFREAQDNLLEAEAELRGAELRGKEKEPFRVEVAPAAIEGKGFGIRAGACVIDFIVQYASNLVAGSISGTFLGVLLAVSGRQFRLDEQALQGVNFIGGLVLSTLYFTLFEWLFGASFGKLILGMRVVHEDGRPCTLGGAFVRALARYIDGILFGLVAYSSMKKTPLQQRLGDKSAKTLVVDYKDAIVQQPRAWWWFLVAAVLYFILAMIIVDLAICTALR